MSTPPQLPYEIRATAARLFAGRTGLSLADMKDFFTEEIQRRGVQPNLHSDDPFLGPILNTLEFTGAFPRRYRETFESLRQAFEYWLSLFPVEDQKSLLLMLCQRANFPMSRGRPPQEKCDELAALLEGVVIHSSIALMLQTLNAEAITRSWQKAISRCQNDPEGAITAMRTLLESVLNHLLDACGVSHTTHDDLPKVGRLLMDKLQIAPGQQSDVALKQVYGGCISVLNGLAALRNHLGDAHGAGREHEVPARHHALYAVHLAGSTALFLWQAWEAYLAVRSAPEKQRI